VWSYFVEGLVTGGVLGYVARMGHQSLRKYSREHYLAEHRERLWARIEENRDDDNASPSKT